MESTFFFLSFLRAADIMVLFLGHWGRKHYSASTAAGMQKGAPGDSIQAGIREGRRESERESKRERDGVPAREALFVPYTYIL